MFYVITDIRQFPGLDLVPEHGKELARIGTLVRHAAVEQLPIAHPDYPDIAITVSQLAGPTDDPRADWKNTVAMGTGDFSWDDPATWTGALDRCPSGTGTSARMAVLHGKGELPLGQDDPFDEGLHRRGHLGMSPLVTRSRDFSRASRFPCSTAPTRE